MTSADPFNEGKPAASARRRRSLAIALLLVLFVALVFSVTMVRLAQNIAERPGPATAQDVAGG